jgi:hypothetical protein
VAVPTHTFRVIRKGEPLCHSVVDEIFIDRVVYPGVATGEAEESMLAPSKFGSGASSTWARGHEGPRGITAQPGQTHNWDARQRRQPIL